MNELCHSDVVPNFGLGILDSESPIITRGTLGKPISEKHPLPHEIPSRPKNVIENIYSGRYVPGEFVLATARGGVYHTRPCDHFKHSLFFKIPYRVAILELNSCPYCVDKNEDRIGKSLDVAKITGIRSYSEYRNYRDVRKAKNTAAKRLKRSCVNRNFHPEEIEKVQMLNQTSAGENFCAGRYVPGDHVLTTARGSVFHTRLCERTDPELFYKIPLQWRKTK